MSDSYFEENYFEEGPYGKQGEEIIKRNYKMLLDNAKVANFLPDNPKLILDFGCACGVGTVYLSNHYPKARIVGIDISRYAINKAKTNYKRENIDYLRLDLTSMNSVNFLKKRYNKFDLIFTRDILEHIPYSDQEKVLLAFCKLLGKKGVVIAQTPNKLNLLSYMDRTHIGLRSAKSWKNLFQKFFDRVEVFEKQYVPIIWRFRKNKELLEFPLPFIGFNIYIFARKSKSSYRRSNNL